MISWRAPYSDQLSDARLSRRLVDTLLPEDNKKVFDNVQNKACMVPGSSGNDAKQFYLNFVSPVPHSITFR
jgi:hypothetical protein